MSQSKLNYQQIIDRLKVLNIPLEDFAFENIGGRIEDYPEALEAQKNRKEFFEKHRAEGNWKPNAECVSIYNSMPNEYKIAKSKFKETLNLDWKEIHQQGGEGQGDHWESVKYFPEHDVYIKVTGFYQSYNGTEFYGGYEGCCAEVKPKEKTITVYE